MKMNPRNTSLTKLSIIILLLNVIACGGIGLAYEHNLTSNYAIWATDLLEQAAVVKKDSQGSGASSVIPPMVFTYGWNDDFIIAQRHPNIDFNSKIDESITEWYILIVAEETIHGPLNEQEYQLLRRELNIPTELDFSHTITP